MFYLVIDLEMCRVPRDYRNKAYHYAYETIQIGAVLLNEEFKQVGTIREYVHPEHGGIDPFIEKLTGIKNSQVKKAPCIGEALVHMIDWIGDREYKVYTWSESDRNQLLHEITAKQITDESVDAFMMEDRWVDYQMVFSQRFQLTRRIRFSVCLDPNRSTVQDAYLRWPELVFRSTRIAPLNVSWLLHESVMTESV